MDATCSTTIAFGDASQWICSGTKGMRYNMSIYVYWHSFKVGSNIPMRQSVLLHALERVIIVPLLSV